MQTKHDGASQLQTLAVSNFDIPGDPKFPLNPFYEKPGGRADAGEMGGARAHVCNGIVHLMDINVLLAICNSSPY